MDHDTLEMLRSSLRHMLTEASDRPLAARLEELGWSDVVAEDEAAATRTLFEVKGETLSSADALGPIMATSLGRPSAAVVLPMRGAAASIAEQDRVVVDGLLLGGVKPVGEVLAATADGVVFAAAARSLTVEPGHGFDDALGVLHVTAHLALTAATRVTDDGAQWAVALAKGRAMLATELVAIGHHVIRSAVEYTGARVQYGRAIGSFQALQHRIASAHTTLVAAGRLAVQAAVSGDPWTSLVAKSLSGRAAEEACTQAQQCYGAIGFTWEHEFHRYLRRAYALDGLLGDWRTLEFEIGMKLQASGEVPRIGAI